MSGCSRNMDDLDPGFRARVETLLDECESRGTPMRPYCTLRHPEEQARLWRQSRRSSYIYEKIEWLRANGAPYVADVLDRVGPSSGPKVTGAMPGESWHQHGLAVDCYWLLDGDSEWDPDKMVTIKGRELNGYRVYHSLAQSMDFGVVVFNGDSVDWPHVQGPLEGSPRSTMDWPRIDAQMKERFG